ERRLEQRLRVRGFTARTEPAASFELDANPRDLARAGEPFRLGQEPLAAVEVTAKPLHSRELREQLGAARVVGLPIELVTEALLGSVEVVEIPAAPQAVRHRSECARARLRRGRSSLARRGTGLTRSRLPPRRVRSRRPRGLRANTSRRRGISVRPGAGRAQPVPGGRPPSARAAGRRIPARGRSTRPRTGRPQSRARGRTARRTSTATPAPARTDLP